MFFKKAKTIKALQQKVLEQNDEIFHLQKANKETTLLANTLLADKRVLVEQLQKAQARLREIQDKSNARTRKYRAKAKEAKKKA